MKKSRIASFLIDSIVVILICYVFFVMMYTFLIGDINGNYNEVVGNVDSNFFSELYAFINILVVYYLYVTFSYMTKSRQTFGNKIIGLKLVFKKEDNKIFNLFMRNFLMVFTLGVMFIFTDKDNKVFYDNFFEMNIEQV
jgi:uncharacterized RDD family membrane protein YckC